MITKIHSSVEPDKILHIICRTRHINSARTDLVDEQQYLQLAFLNYEKGTTPKPHKHIYKEVPNSAIAQESWVVLSGKVKATFYDINDKIVHTDILNPGDLSITLFGGHNYEILEENTRVLEYKTGPYYGQKLDKEFINEED